MAAPARVDLASAIRASKLPTIKLRYQIGEITKAAALVEAQAVITNLGEICHALEKAVLEEVSSTLPYVMPMLKGMSADYDRHVEAKAQVAAGQTPTTFMAGAGADGSATGAHAHGGSSAIVPDDVESLHLAIQQGYTVILIKPGRYELPAALKISRPLTIRGMGIDPGEVHLECAANIVINIQLPYDHPDGCEIAGLTLSSNLWQSAEVGRSVPSPFIDMISGRTTLDNCVVQHPNNRTAVNVRQDACSMVLDCTFDATIDISGIASLSRNTIADCNGIGIMVSGDRKDPRTGQTMLTTIVSNTILRCDKYGIWLRRQANCQITDNVIRHISNDAVSIEDPGTFAQLTGNKVLECDGSAICSSSGSEAEISQHTIEKCCRNGLIITGKGTKTTLVCNSISGCGGHGVLCLSGGYTRLEDNVIEVCQKSCIAVLGNGTSATICANVLRIWPTHNYPHIETDKAAAIKAYGNASELVGVSGKLNKEGALLEDPSKKAATASAPKTSVKDRENQFDFMYDVQNPWLRSEADIEADLKAKKSAPRV